MLLGHDDGFVRDKDMKVTVAFNRFGPNCIQRMPRIRHGYAHVVNNFYDGWRDYAMGGSMNPTIKSQGNLYVAVGNKEVIWKEDGPGRGTSWNLKSVNDAFINGASFRQVGSAGVSPHYKPDEAFAAGNPDQVHALTRDAGALRCHANGC
ncbi:uncharacterized protein A4U43_C07F21510 [Asparagus officinalis]|uniref:Pectate lyase n=2 Tax=Asparagus officinalis TaxID=4686 RepID=A0A5P1EE39_ASPOF|nr:uncharacterized protein A4U43_C07F21510 [Asparagus officinalis]